MKFKLTKKKIVYLFITVILLLTQPAYASTNLQVVGTDIGLEVIPQDEKLFNELNIGPGDLIESKVRISNDYVDGFELFLRAERLDEEPMVEAPDLYEKLLMTVSYKGEEIFSGPMNEFAKENGIPLGKFQPGDVQDLDVLVHLPGAETGNDFMGLTLNNRWVFTAQSDTIIIDDEDPPLGPGDPVIIEDEEVPLGGANLPKTGGTPATLFIIVGVVVAAMGFVLKKKE